MTLIVGVKCSNGVVMGADGAATLTDIRGAIIRQPTNKLQIVDKSLIVGIAGSVGLGQIMTGEIERVWQTEKSVGRTSSTDLRTRFAEAIRPHVFRELDVARSGASYLGPETMASAICETMIAAPLCSLSQDLRLLTFDHLWASEEATNSLPFAAIGSGQRIAAPFLAFLRRIFWKDAVPDIVDGVFATMWTLLHTIETNPGGVAEPLEIMVLQPEDRKPTVRVLTRQQLQDHRESTGNAERMLLEWRKQQKETTAPPGKGPPEFKSTS